ncbi:Spy0128 family protein [Collinsella aerofaciens]|uniref:Streptococcal pilin isopeptide linkage domain-containing protein n=1 Tax=Collinsella aerofaciens TaxID=74426 RepID=A0A2D1TZF6_9ACTN|nr:FctA domain-containing protein [Collinsella aerofaciens]ATP54748.1 hypothetical protein CSV91_09530 [Collinsella aerofaciens]
MKANSEKTKQSKKATRRVLAGVLCGASVLSLVLSLVMPPISQAIANDAQTDSTEKTVMGGGSSSESTDVDNTNNGDTENQNSDETEGDETGDDALRTAPLSDDTGAESAAQSADAKPSDDETNDESAIAPANVSADDYIEVKGNVANQFTNGGKFRLTDSAYSDTQIAITKDTTIDLAGCMLYNYHGVYNDRTPDSFFVVRSGAKLTIEDSGNKDLGKKTIDDQTQVPTSAGQLATMEWDKGNGFNSGTPESLTYYETKSVPNSDCLGTTETTYKHVVTGFGAIDAASDSGSVKYVVEVEAGCTLNLEGGMITTAANLGDNGHVIFSRGAVNISGGYVTNGNGGGWGGGLCIAGTNPKLEMTGGVVAGNKAAAGGGIFADFGATLNLAGGIISGNATYGNPINNGENTRDGGYGGGVYTKGANVTISGSACITNNRVDARITDIEHFGNNGLLGGGGIACTHDGTLNLTGGFVTANYSYEAGGGVYAGFYDKDNDGEIEKITFKMTGGTIAGNVADNAEGGGLRVAGGDSAGTTATINASDTGRVYITNNKTNTGSTKGRGGDWGGGGVFIQKGGKLNIVKTLITKNEAGGWGGGVGACPTGETIVSHSNGAAIYSNTDYGEHFSAGGDGKDQDKDFENSEYITADFKKEGHKDFFLVRKKGSEKTVAVVLGKMLGNRSAGWKGTCDGQKITIDPNGGAEAKYMFGLEAHPTEDAMKKAQEAATTIISGNCSYTHGGGIMTNGDLVVGEVTALNVYPAIKVKANKVLLKDGAKKGLKDHPYQFKLLGAAANSKNEPYWNENGTLNENGCEAMPAVNVNENNGEILIDTGANYQSGDYDLYLVEVPIDEKGTTFDKAIYKIHIKVGTTPANTTSLLGIDINRYGVDKSASTVSVKKGNAASFTKCGFYEWTENSADSTVSTVKIGDESNPAFINELAPYQASGTWTPQVTKRVDGGEMKKFEFELFTKDSDGREKSLQTKCTSAESGNPQIVTFDPVPIGPLGVKDLTGGKATFTYYIRECAASKGDGTKHEGYKNDTKRFKVVVTATDNHDGTLNCTPTYYEVDASGNASETPTTDPTFTNTYSTSLPLSGMSGVTLTYLAGAAVLCAAAAWMHIRRKANAKGGERRE